MPHNVDFHSKLSQRVLQNTLPASHPEHLSGDGQPLSEAQRKGIQELCKNPSAFSLQDMNNLTGEQVCQSTACITKHANNMHVLQGTSLLYIKTLTVWLHFTVSRRRHVYSKRACYTADRSHVYSKRACYTADSSHCAWYLRWSIGPCCPYENGT